MTIRCAPSEYGRRRLRHRDVDAGADALATPRLVRQIVSGRQRRRYNDNDDDCDHVSINGGVDPKRCDREIEDINDDSASLVDDGQRPTKSCRLGLPGPG